MKGFKSVDAYIKGQPKKIQTALKQIRSTIRNVEPSMQEMIRYGIPTYKLRGNVVHFGAFTDHISFFPTSSGVEKFKKELTKYKTSKGTIQFPFDKPVPLRLVRKIVRFRVNEVSRKK